MTQEELKRATDDLDTQLQSILPEDWQDKWETHEEQRDLFERCYDKADVVASKAIALLRAGLS